MGTLGKGLKPDGSGCREDGRGGGLAGIDAELDEGRFEDVARSNWRCRERSRLPFFDQSALAFSVSFAFAGMADRSHYASNCHGAACQRAHRYAQTRAYAERTTFTRGVSCARLASL